MSDFASFDAARTQVIDFAPGDIVTESGTGPIKLYSRDEVHTAIVDGVTMAADEAHLSHKGDRFTWAISAVMTYLDAPSAPWAEVKNRHYTPTQDTAADDESPQYTREQVSQAVNNGVDKAAERIGRRRFPDDLDNLVVNAALTLLDAPEADFHAVVVECYSDSPRVVRSWL
ncbi:hypothetical protein [Streptomyces noursei]|uniref:hypothetical protein n=1 Tax=Streptomyces noursei TaxID=1971 RepID=UPI00167AD45A|nr:hypothetical protein [Streptomyces noursei]MCZ1014406.1 hypothetical protein [Streptomyces noursei]GGW94780.1 hypothetical protein GCM10010341_14920 [Streptomyces noursei]